MDENDFDQILHTDFHPNTVPPPTELHNEHELQDQNQQQHDQQQDNQVEQITLQSETPQDDQRGISRESDAYNFAEDSQSPLPNFDRNDDANNNVGDDRELTYEDKKARQRDQNRHAALKSRAKKRDR
jgi:hypothetical protein